MPPCIPRHTAVPCCHPPGCGCPVSDAACHSSRCCRPPSPPSLSCIVDTVAVVDYFEFGRPFGVTVGILLGYLGIMHALTYLAMVVSARKEAR